MATDTAPGIAEHLANIDRDGYTIVPDVFDADRAAAIVAKLDELERDLGITSAQNDFEGTATVRIYNLLAHGDLFEQIAVEPAVLPVVEGVLDVGCLVSTISSIVIGPGETPQPIHADDQVMPLPKPHVATVCNSMWALTEFTEAHGATRIIPGSHLADHSPEYGASFDTIPAEMAQGSVLVWHGSLWHGGGTNTTDQRRYGIAMNYCAGWVRQQENQQLGLSIETVRGFTPRLQQLCGFDIYRGLIGHIDKQTPARRLLAPIPTVEWCGITADMSNAPEFNIDVEDFWRDPYPALAAMRSTAPIAAVPQLGATLITTRDHISACEKNVSVFSSDQPGGLMNVLMGQNMMRRDGAEHQAERKVYYPALSPIAVRDVWSAQFAEHATRILDEMDARYGSGGDVDSDVDLVSTYATQLSGEALKSMTGLTNITSADMNEWSQAMIDGIANYTGDPEPERRCHEATTAIDTAIDERLVAVRASPDHSLLSVMLESGMPLANVRANIKLTISGGQNEPRDAISGCIWALLAHPDQLALVRERDATWRNVFEEYCRWVAPIGMSPRRVAATSEYGGVRFDENDRVFLMFGSANRDEAYFAEPDRFDVTRNTKMSLAFGAGPHFCAGAAASRSLVGDIALPMIFERLAGLHLASDQPVEFGGWAFRGPLSVPVSWAGRRA